MNDLRQWARGGPVDSQAQRQTEDEAVGLTLSLFALVALVATLTIGVLIALMLALAR